MLIQLSHAGADIFRVSAPMYIETALFIISLHNK